MSEKILIQKQKELEMKIIAFLIQNPNKNKDYKPEQFQHPTTKEIFTAIRFFEEKGNKVTLDEVHIFVKKKIPNFEYSELAKIVENFQDFSNIRYLKKELKDSWIKNVDNKHILSDVATVYQSADELTVEKLSNLRNKIDKNIAFLTTEESDPTMKSSISRHREIIKERNKGENKRTLGINALDKAIGSRLAKRGSMLTLFGLSGSSKSSFTLYLTNALVNNPRKICVMYFTLENTEEDVVDMLVSIRTGIKTSLLETPEDLQSHEIERIEKELNKLENAENLHVYDESSLSIDQLESKIIQSKDIFREKGLLPEDEYCVVVIDLATMLTDFDDLDPRRMEQVVNRLHRLCRKEHLFMIHVVQANENDLRGGKKFENVDQIKKYRLLRENIKHGASFFERSRVVMSLKRNRELVKTYLPQEREEWENMPDIIECHIIKNNKGATGLLEFGFSPENLQIAPIVYKDNEV